MTERRSLTERSGRTKVAISPSFVEPGARLAAAGSRRGRRDIYMDRTAEAATTRNDGAKGDGRRDETTRESMSNEQRRVRELRGRNGMGTRPYPTRHHFLKSIRPPITKGHFSQQTSTPTLNRSPTNNPNNPNISINPKPDNPDGVQQSKVQRKIQ